MSGVVAIFLPVEVVSVALESDSHLLKKFVLFASFESPLEMMSNTLYFILKSFFVLKIFKFLSLLFGHVGKRFD